MELSLKAVFENIVDVVFIKDLSGRYTLINPAGESLFGVGAAQILGRTDEELFEGRCIRVLSETDELALMGETVDFEHPAAVGGRSYILHTVKAPVLDARERVAGICGVSRDISDRREAEDQLRRLNRTYRALMEATRVILGARREPELLSGVLKVIVDRGGYLGAWASFFAGPQKAPPSVKIYGCAQDACPLRAESALPGGSPGEALSAAKPLILKESPPVCRRVQGCRAAAALPLIFERGTLGLLGVCSREPGSFDGEYRDLFVNLAHDLAGALVSLRSRGEAPLG